MMAALVGGLQAANGRAAKFNLGHTGQNTWTNPMHHEMTTTIP